jgi:two-component system, NtrC family, nitrogen regulation sensor histidine kinase NtrY
MGFKRFRLNCLFRILLIGATVALLLYLVLFTTLYASMIVVALIGIAEVYGLIVFVERSNRDMIRFLEAIEHSDLSDSISTGLRGGTFDELNASFARVLGQFRLVRQEREENLRYLETVVQHVGIGLIAYREDGAIELANTAARKLLHVARLDRIEHLDVVSGDFATCLRNATPGQRQLVTFGDGKGPQQISVLTTQLRLSDRNITLASFQNITSELGAKELEAWQNLIRVLAHEIRNSLTPISSLAATIAESLGDGNKTTAESGLDRHDMHEALATIQRRSEGLLSVVDSYRRLTRIPAPSFGPVSVSSLLNDTVTLLQPQVSASNMTLTCSVEPRDLALCADVQLIAQVLMNLSLNAIESLSGRPNGSVRLCGTQDGFGRVKISVTDNGPGIVPEALEQVFVPFYTTKRSGSGIGLSLSRQIMRLHHGQLTVSSTPDCETIFTLIF